MRLEVDDNGEVLDPTPSDIQWGVEQLTSGAGFVILSHDQLTYMQAVPAGEDGCVLEYQEGDTDRHFQAQGTVTPAQVVSAMQRYAANDDAWKADFQWTQETIKDGRGAGCLGLVLLAAALTLSVVVA